MLRSSACVDPKHAEEIRTPMSARPVEDEQLPLEKRSPNIGLHSTVNCLGARKTARPTRRSRDHDRGGRARRIHAPDQRRQRAPPNAQGRAGLPQPSGPPHKRTIIYRPIGPDTARNRHSRGAGEMRRTRSCQESAIENKGIAHQLRTARVSVKYDPLAQNP
jgi:hypothetical protein